MKDFYAGLDNRWKYKDHPEVFYRVFKRITTDEELRNALVEIYEKGVQQVPGTTGALLALTNGTESYAYSLAYVEDDFNFILKNFHFVRNDELLRNSNSELKELGEAASMEYQFNHRTTKTMFIGFVDISNDTVVSKRYEYPNEEAMQLMQMYKERIAKDREELRTRSFTS